MTPPQPVPDVNDPTALAVRLAELHGSQQILQREVAVNIQNLTSTASALQAELRHVGEKLESVARLQEQQFQHSEGLNRAFQSIEKLANEFGAWRERHEGENRVTSDCVTEFRGQFRGVWMAGGLVVALVSTLYGLAWTRINERFADVETSLAEARTERVAVEARRQSTHDTDVQRLQQLITEQRGQIEQLQAARGLR